MSRQFHVVDAPQRSQEWRTARVGRLTASRARDMLTTIKSGEAAARRDLRVQLAIERLTGEPQDNDFVSADMQRGTDLEPEAFAAYEGATGVMLARCGFVAHDALPIGCSPDGVIGDFDGIVELKVPKSATHLSYLRAGDAPSDYVPQVTHSLWVVTRAAFCDFVSYDPRFPPELRLYRVRVDRDERAIAAYAEKAQAFLAEVERDVEAITALHQGAKRG